MFISTLLSISHTHFTHSHSQRFDQRGFLVFQQKKKKGRERKSEERGVFKKLRRKSDLVLKFSPVRLWIFKSFDPFFPLLVNSFVPCP